MTIHSTVTSALNSVLANAWAIELPPEPAFPAIVFDIDSSTESNWVFGADYVQHVVSVFVYAKTRSQLMTYPALIRAAMETIPGYMAEEERGDAEYQEFPGVYAYFQNFRIRGHLND